MYNYNLNTTNGTVTYKMKAGKDFVFASMPMEKAEAICMRGSISIGEDADYPICVDGKYWFAGEIESIQEREVENSADGQPIPAGGEAKPKKDKKKPKKTAED